MAPDDAGTDAPLRDVLDEDVELFLALVFREVADRSEDDFETVEFVSVAEGLAAERGINLVRVVNEHPDVVEDYIGDGLSFPDSTVAEFDRIVEEHYTPRDGD